MNSPYPPAGALKPFLKFVFFSKSGQRIVDGSSSQGCLGSQPHESQDQLLASCSTGRSKQEEWLKCCSQFVTSTEHFC